jgi:hypothetical protein
MVARFAKPRLISSLEVMRELDREEGIAMRGIALELVAARKRGDWQAVDEVARHLAAVAMVKDPPEGDDDDDGRG